jgi:hypothetical protein
VVLRRERHEEDETWLASARKMLSSAAPWTKAEEGREKRQQERQHGRRMRKVEVEGQEGEGAMEKSMAPKRMPCP